MRQLVRRLAAAAVEEEETAIPLLLRLFYCGLTCHAAPQLVLQHRLLRRWVVNCGTQQLAMLRRNLSCFRRSRFFLRWNLLCFETRYNFKQLDVEKQLMWWRIFKLAKIAF